MMKVALPTLMLLAVVAAAVGCKCPVPTVKRQYFKPENTRVVRAVVTSKRTQNCLNCKIFYKIKVLEAFKGCKTPADLEVSTADNTGACGISLQVGTGYLMYLSSAKVPEISSCQGIQKFSDVSASDLKFLRTRKVCCGTRCSCLPGTRRWNCYMEPCKLRPKPPCPNATKCVDNYCGGCLAEWFKTDGSPACM
jgi:hypothetical protein